MSIKKYIVIVLGIVMIYGVTGCRSTAERPVSDELTNEPTKETTNEYATDEIQSDVDLKAMLAADAGVDEEEIKFFDMDDFDGDGEDEAFALIGSKADYDLETEMVEGNIWFVNSDGAEMFDDGMGMGFECGDTILDFGTKKYIVFNDIYATGALSYVYEVNGKKVSNADFSGRGTVTQKTDSEEFRIVDSSYDAELDPEIDGMLGHTWKSYYFYYDDKSESVKEYGGIEISEEKANDLAGKNIVDECLSSKDKLENIIYRENGLIHINYSEKDENGCISYFHRTWDIINECYINDYAEKSDEEQSGTYITALCPDIAEYPTED